MAERGHRAAPVVLLGLASGALTAVASTRPWARVTDVDPLLGADKARLESLGHALPVAAATSLVVLAAWGVLLVARGRLRVAVAWLGVLAAAATVSAVVVARFVVPGWVERAADDAGDPQVTLDWTPWFWAALLGAVVSLLVTVVAARSVRTWPEMAARYDAPGRGAGPQTPRSNLDLWQAMDEGRDPTAEH